MVRQVYERPATTRHEGEGVLNQLLALVSHPMQALGLLLLVLAGAYILGALMFAVWAASEERRQDRERDRFDQILRASTPVKDQPSRVAPRAPGMGTRRIG